MKKATSLYLDLVRFAAALTVFLSHASNFLEKLFWRFDSYSQTAVIIFFVLSGYVIAHVIETRERTFREYVASRFGRLYSVALPAMVLAAIVDHLVPQSANFQDGPEWWSYIATVSFLSRFWLWPAFEPHIMQPFWSLSFEISYYAGIALVVFANGRIRWGGLTLLCLLAGPSIIILAPIWFLGYAAYDRSRSWTLPVYAGIALWVTSASMLLACYIIETHILTANISFLRIMRPTWGAVLAYYTVGICFAANLVGFSSFADRSYWLLSPFTALIRWLGSITFAFYLFHFPLVVLFASYPLGEPGSWIQRAWLIGGTCLTVGTLGHLCEQSKGIYKRWFLSMWNRIAVAAPVGS